MQDDDDVRAPDPEPVPPHDAPSVVWPPWKRIGFRFLAAYFLLYTFPFPLDSIPWLGGKLSEGVGWLWQQVAVWTGHTVFGIEGEIFVGQTGSGDTTVDYLKLLLMVALALVATLVWSLVDRRRTAYPRAARWLVVGCRFFLGLVLLVYGFAKVIPTQFSTPSLARLLQTYGSSSPMGITWTFMGLAPAYTIFSGLMETIPGFLLFFGRTRLLGACLGAAALTNVAIINYCFDVPVKLYSSHLLVMSLALVLLDARRLVALFLRNRPAPPADLRPLFQAKKLKIAAAAVGFLIVAAAVWDNVSGGLEAYRMWGAGRTKPETWGIYDVETFRVDGAELPPLLTDETRWLALVIDRSLPFKWRTFEQPGRVSIQHMDGKITSHAVELDEQGGTLTFLPQGQSGVAAAREAGVEVTDVLRFERPEPGRMIARGTYEGKNVEIELRARDLGEMLLISRGYHWINELPFNK